jgi:MSHA pilin protein MshD
MVKIRARAGYLLIEASAAYVILVLGIVSIVPIFHYAMIANERSQEALKSAELAQELMEEIKLRRWDETGGRIGFPTGSPSLTLGPDSGETSTNKATFDDVDDFNGWTENGVKDPLNNAIPSLSDYTRSVTVQYVTSSFSVTASTTNYKLVTVCVSKASVNRSCLYWVATNY